MPILSRKKFKAPLLFILIGTFTYCFANAGPIRDAIQARIEKRIEKKLEDEAELQEEGKLQDTKFVVPKDVTVVKDLAYGADRLQKLDVYRGASPKNASLIVMVHGGAWMVGDKTYSNVVKNKIAYWIPKGYIFISINYRMSRKPNPLDQLDDMALAMSYIQKNAAAWGGDSKKIILMGHSAGAHLVSLLTADLQFVKRRNVQPWLATIALDSAAFNVVETMENKHFGFYDKVFGSDKKFWEDNSPFHRLKKGIPPMYIVCGSRRHDSCPQANAFMKKSQDLGNRVEVLSVDMKHGPINGDLGDNSEYTKTVAAFIQNLVLP